MNRSLARKIEGLSLVALLGATFAAGAVAPGGGSQVGLGQSSHEKMVVELPEITVSPGGVLRWPATDTVSCRLGERAFPPVGASCLLAIDLEADGKLEAWRESADRIERLPLAVGDYPYPEQHIKLADNSRVDLSPANQERAARERERIVALWKLESRVAFTLPLHPPLENMPAGGRFGSRRFFNGKPRSPHTGRDYAADRGTPVLAVAAGTVKLAEEHFFGGNSIFVDHGGGLISMVLHLDETFVEPGDPVTRGMVIGSVGSTGRSTGPHLHFGIRLHGQRVDPALLLADPGKLPMVPLPD